MAARHQRPRAAAAAISEAENAIASHKGGVGMRQAGSIGGVPVDHAFGEPQQTSGKFRHPHPARKDGHETQRHEHAQQRHHEGIGGEAGDAHAVEVDDHGQRQAQLDDGRSHHHFVDEKEEAGGQGDGPMRQAQSLGQQAHFDAKLGHPRRQVQVAVAIVQACQAARQRTRGGLNERNRKRTQKADRQKGELKAGLEELIGIGDQKAQRHGSQRIERPAAPVEVAAQEQQRRDRRPTACRGPAIPSSPRRTTPPAR